MSIDTREAARLYRERAVEGASPARLVRLLLERALRGIDRAAAVDAKDPSSPFVEELARAREIVLELRLAIEPGPSPELAASTSALYEFAAERIATSLAQRDATAAKSARPVLARLHEAWVAIDGTVA